MTSKVSHELGEKIYPIETTTCETETTRPRTLKVTSEICAEPKFQLQSLQTRPFHSTTVMQAQTVFVSFPRAGNSGDDYSLHPQSEVYRQHYEKRKAEKQWYDLFFKTAIVGSSGSGKTSFLFRGAYKSYPPKFDNIVPYDFYVVNRGYSDASCPWSIQNGPLTVKLQMWDNTSSDLFRRSSTYYRGVSGVFIVFDVTDYKSFQNSCQMTSELETYAPPHVAAVLVGTKCDYSCVKSISDIYDHANMRNTHGQCREVAFEEAKEFADNHQIPYLECSALTGERIEDVLATMIHHVVMKREQHDLLTMPILRETPPSKNSNMNNSFCNIGKGFSVQVPQQHAHSKTEFLRSRMLKE